MSEFPRASPHFAQKVENVREMFDRTEGSVAREEIKARDTVKVSLSDLEEWYEALNDSLAFADPLEEDSVESLRDSIYRYLKG